MANTYTQCYAQYVFAVQHRKAFIAESFRNDLQKYMTGLTQSQGHKMLSIYCMPDHAHVLVGMNPKQSMAEFVNKLKSGSSKWINESGFLNLKFNWQNGYGGFTYSKREISNVGDYIDNQPERHGVKTFRNEYQELLDEHQVPHEKKYLFNFFD